ncbi:MAG: TIR domain-containing protein [Parvularculaceae bacterium]
MGDGKKYRAFISYSHADEEWGGWLQRRLERYRAPGALGQALMKEQGASARLSPVFRDRDDLPAGDDLNQAIQQALAESEFQIVLCSPRAAKSRWVNEEAKLFYKLHGPGRTLAIIVDGEPGASATPGREDEECLPPALRFRLDADGNLTDEPAEPIAADARESGDGKNNAFLKIAAGMFGVGLDDLIRRDQRRRARIVQIAAASALSIIAALSATTYFAHDQRKLAITRQNEAEGLIKFMLTDLRDKLEPLGKLDVLESVGDKVLDYYSHQDLNSLSDDAQSRRATALIQLGQIEQSRGDYEKARKSYEAAFESTARLLARNPNNPQRIFDHAQSVFYIGDLARISGDNDESAKRFKDYYRMAEQLVGFDPTNKKWLLEESYALSNLGINEYERGNFDAANPYFERSIKNRKRLLDDTPDDKSMALSYAYALSWLALNELRAGRYTSASNIYDTQIGVYESLLSINPDDHGVLFTLMLANQREGMAKLFLGDTSSALTALGDAESKATRLLMRDPTNQLYRSNASFIATYRSYVDEMENRFDDELLHARRALEYVENDRTNVSADYAYGIALAAHLRASINLGREDELIPEAKHFIALAGTNEGSEKRIRRAIAEVALALGQYHEAHGNHDLAQSEFEVGLSSFAGEDDTRSELRLLKARLNAELGNIAEARRLASDLGELSPRYPEYVSLLNRLQSGTEQ